MSESSRQALWLSLQVALLTVLIATPLSVGLATWMARARWRGKVLLDTLILLPLGLPPAVIGFWLLISLGDQGAVGQWVRRDLGWHLSLYPTGAVLAATFMTVPLMTRLLRPAFEAHDPMLLPVARTLGASRWQAWWTVSLPLATPAVLSAMMLGMAAAWGESGAVLVLMSTLPVDPQAAPAAVALWQSLREPRQAQVAWDVAAVSLGVAVLAVLLSEALRARWRQQWRVHGGLAPQTVGAP